MAKKNLIVFTILIIGVSTSTNAYAFTNNSNQITNTIEKHITFASFFVFPLTVIHADLIASGASLDQDSHGPIPHWVKNNAKWWYEGKISDKDFALGMRWLVENHIIKSKVPRGNDDITRFTVSDSSRTIAKLWSENRMTDIEFLNGVNPIIKNANLVTDKTVIYGNVEADMAYPRTILFNLIPDSKITKVNGINVRDVHFELRNDLGIEYNKIGVANDTKKYAVIVPVFTLAAYSEPGFYTFYRGNCSECTTKKIDLAQPLSYTSSSYAVKTLTALGYVPISDIDVDKNPEILKQYDRIILLHNEYVTKKEFDAITSHPNVVYLYPNSLYAEISVDYNRNEISLVRGHGFPTGAKNGFDWIFDNSSQEYNTHCNNWNFVSVDNGKMLDCYPENVIAYDQKLLQEIKS